MSTITTEQVKALRDQTGVSIMQCKQALEAAGGDATQARAILEKKGAEMALKKSLRGASDGLVVIKNNGSSAVVVMLYCETDFVAKNADFRNLAEKLTDIASEEGAAAAIEKSKPLIEEVVLKIGENIQLGSVEAHQGAVIGSYVHHDGKSGAVAIFSKGNPEVAKDVAMHITAMKPLYLNKEDIAEEKINEMSQLFAKEVAESGKPESIQEKILEGKLKDFFSEKTLMEQSFFKTGDISIKELLVQQGGAILEGFKRYSIF